MREALDFHAEGDALAAILADAGDAEFGRVTLFKGWTIDDVIGHLHLWDHAAALTLQSPAEFRQLSAWIFKRMQRGQSHAEIQKQWLNGLHGRALFDRWRDHYPRLADLYRDADPETRVAWAGPDMSARSAITARQMETWAHGQEVFDLLGIGRSDADRLKNIAHLGVKTYSWSFVNRKQAVPNPKPFVSLTAPSGAVWEWNEQQVDNCVSGEATQFCQVVTQTRNIADTSLRVIGPPATRWMAIAQCFAGQPEDPPAPGTRHRA